MPLDTNTLPGHQGLEKGEVVVVEEEDEEDEKVDESYKEGGLQSFTLQ